VINLPNVTPGKPRSRSRGELPRGHNPQETGPCGWWQGPQRRRRGAGYISDPKRRKAIEEHAEQLATAHYEGQGWTVEKLGKPYYLRGLRSTEERHVEVKGTTGAATSVELTINEVLHARDMNRRRSSPPSTAWRPPPAGTSTMSASPSQNSRSPVTHRSIAANSRPSWNVWRRTGASAWSWTGSTSTGPGCS
jgi:hypothetical protein